MEELAGGLGRRRPHVVGRRRTPTDELDALPTDGDVFELGPVSSDRFLEDTLEHPPDDYSEFTFNAVASRAAGA